MPISNRIYVYDQATARLWTAIVTSEIGQRPVLNWVGKPKVTRHAGAIRNLQGDNPLDQRFSAISSNARIEIETIRETDIPEYISTIKETGKNFAQQQSASFFASLDRMFDHSKRRSSDESNEK